MNEPGEPRVEALFYDEAVGGAVKCRLCFHGCKIPDGGAGLCQVRENADGVLYAAGYGRCSAVNLDPVEKKPLRRFHLGTNILSVGGYGCNLRCPFCQNHSIAVPYRRQKININGREEASDAYIGKAEWKTVDIIPPEKLVAYAKKKTADGNIGLAYTYNEPTVGIEYMLDCARLIREAGLLNVLVTNGSCSREALEALLPLTDAMNIDVKAFTEGFYKKLGGDLQTVKETLELSAKCCHIEVTTLIIPGENDSAEEIEGLARWLASVSPEIPLHLSRFFPRYKYTGREPTPQGTILKLKKAAERYCRYVYAGNM